MYDTLFMYIYLFFSRRYNVEKYYGIKKTSELLGLKMRTVRDWVVKGKIKAIKYQGSNRWSIPESEVKRVRGES